MKQRILYYRRPLGETYQRIVTLLAEEGHKVTKPAVFKFCRHFKETGSIKRAPGTGKKSKFTDEAAQIVEGQMQADDETTSEELAAILREKSVHVCARTAVKSTKFHTYVRTYVLLFTYIRMCVNFTVFVPHVASQYVRRALTFLLLVP